MKKTPELQQNKYYIHFMFCTEYELEEWFNSYKNGYPSSVAPMVKVIAELRGFDTSKWASFTR